MRQPVCVWTLTSTQLAPVRVALRARKDAALSRDCARGAYRRHLAPSRAVLCQCAYTPRATPSPALPARHALGAASQLKRASPVGRRKPQCAPETMPARPTAARWPPPPDGLSGPGQRQVHVARTTGHPPRIVEPEPLPDSHRARIRQISSTLFDMLAKNMEIWGATAEFRTASRNRPFRMLPKSGQYLPSLGLIWQTSTNVGFKFAELGWPPLVLANLGQNWRIWATIWQNCRPSRKVLVGLGPKLNTRSNFLWRACGGRLTLTLRSPRAVTPTPRERTRACLATEGFPQRALLHAGAP